MRAKNIYINIYQYSGSCPTNDSSQVVFLDQYEVG